MTFVDKRNAVAFLPVSIRIHLSQFGCSSCMVRTRDLDQTGSFGSWLKLQKKGGWNLDPMEALATYDVLWPLCCAFLGQVPFGGKLC